MGFPPLLLLQLPLLLLLLPFPRVLLLLLPSPSPSPRVLSCAGAWWIVGVQPLRQPCHTSTHSG